MDSLLFWWDRYWQLFQCNIIHTYTFPTNKITSWHISSSNSYVQLLHKLPFMGLNPCAQSLYYTTIWAIWIQSIKSYIISVRLTLILSSLLHLHILNSRFPYGFLTKTVHISHWPHACCMPPHLISLIRYNILVNLVQWWQAVCSV